MHIVNFPRVLDGAAAKGSATEQSPSRRCGQSAHKRLSSTSSSSRAGRNLISRKAPAHRRASTGATVTSASLLTDFQSALSQAAPAALSVEKYAFPSASGLKAKASVERHAKNYILRIEVPVESCAAVPLLCWGAYRATSAKWFAPAAMVPSGSLKDPRTGGAQTIFEAAKDSGFYKVELVVPAEIAPLMIGCLLRAPSPDGRGIREQRFTLPVGCTMGDPAPLGASVASVSADGTLCAVNFAVRSRLAAGMSLCLARSEGGKGAGVMEIALEPTLNRTGDTWHICVEGLRDVATLAYGWRADAADISHFFPGQIMLDPYAQSVTRVSLPAGVHLPPPQRALKAAAGPEPALMGSLSSFLDEFDAGSVPRPGLAMEDLVVLELNARTLSGSVQEPLPEALKGKFLGLVDMIPSLQAAGVTAVVLASALASGDVPGAAVSMFAPEPACAVGTEPSAAVTELKQAIASLHQHGIELILEVDTASLGEGTDAHPAPSSLRGLDAEVYFRPDGALNCGHGAVRALVGEALRHWAREYRVDGFSFAHANNLTLDRDGVVTENPALAEEIANDPVLRGLKFIASPSEAAAEAVPPELPLAGERGFPHWGVWAERNTRFLRDVTKFLGEGAPGMASAIASRITGSADLFEPRPDGGLPGGLAVGRRPCFGLNGLSTSQTLQQVADTLLPVQYPEDFLWQARTTLVRSFLAASVLYQGVPTFSQEVLFSEEMLLLTSILLRFRHKYSELLQTSTASAPLKINWHGPFAGSLPDWDGSAGEAYAPGANFVGYSVLHPDGRSIYIGTNPQTETQPVYLPPPPAGTSWVRVLDTAQPPGGHGAELFGPDYDLQGKATLVLESLPWLPQFGAAGDASKCNI